MFREENNMCMYKKERNFHEFVEFFIFNICIYIYGIYAKTFKKLRCTVTLKHMNKTFKKD